MPQAVIFDVDGTLVDSNDLHTRAWQETFRHFGFEVEYDRVRAQIGKGGDQLIPALLPPKDIESHFDKLNEYRNKLFVKQYLQQVRPFPAVRELFERCKEAGLRVALASSGKEVEVKHYVGLTGIESLFDARTTTDDADKSKPHPDIFAAALERLELAAAEVVVVGDTPYDAEGAGRLGLRTIGVLCGGFGGEVLRKAGCVAVYRDPADLLGCFEQSVLSGRAF